MTDVQETLDMPSEATPANALGRQQETCEEMLSRHRKEVGQLQNKENELKKVAAKSSKAEQKAEKKLVEEEISPLSAKLRAKHGEELASSGYSSTSNGNEKSNFDNLVKALAGVSVTNQPEHAKISKGAKKRGKRAQQEAEREKKDPGRVEQPCK